MDNQANSDSLLARNKELENRCKALQETVRMQGQFADIANVLASVVELPKLTAALLPALLSATQLKAVAFCLRDDEGAFHVLASQGLGVPASAKRRMQEVAAEASLVKDIVTTDLRGDEGLTFLRQNGVGSVSSPALLAAIPCIYEGFSNSVLLFAATEPVTIETLSFISALTPNIGLSVNNACSYDTIKKTTEALDGERTKLNAVMYNMADGLLVTDVDGVIVRANRALLEMFGYGKGSMAGRKAAEVFVPELAGLIETCRKSGMRDAISLEIGLPGARIAKALATALTQETTQGDARPGGPPASIVPTGVVILTRDITREKEVDRMKTDFLSTVSHELRTPLTSVLGFARIIKKRMNEVILPLVKTEDRKIQKTIQQVGDNLEIILSEGERLTALINDVLDLAKMEAGKIEWKMEPMPVSEVLEQAAAAVSSLSEQKGLALRLDIAADLPLVIGDRNRLMQVVINLVSNAVKFTDSGSITCGAARRGDEIVISVHDTGMGIAIEDLPRVFEKFKQVGDTLTNKPKGTGLGLPICREIVARHGGRIWAESEPGRGSTFLFTVPAGAAAGTLMKTMDIDMLVSRLEQHVAALPDSAEGGKDILVVDDEAHIRELLRQELEARKYRVHEAKDGLEAVEQAKKERPDLIILDVMMPGINGFDVAAVLKNDPATMDIPIIIHSIVDDVARGLRIGVDRYLKKPVDPEELLRNIGDLLSRGASHKKVFVVDEDESLVKTLSETLRLRGYHAVGVCNGRECIEKAQAEEPDMIIIDSVFSDRHDIIKTLKFEKNMRNIYFVIIGGEGEPGP